MGILIAFDPGLTSGVCIGQHTGGKYFKVVNSLEIAWADRFKIFNLLYSNRAQITAIVIEEFRLFANKTTLNSQINSEMPSSRIIGIIELSAALCKLTHCIAFQTPAERKNVDISKEHISQLQRSRHCIDAYMHLKYYILCNYRKGIL